jgi:hypothetical protein
MSRPAKRRWAQAGAAALLLSQAGTAWSGEPRGPAVSTVHFAGYQQAQRFNPAPATRTVHPTSIFKVAGRVGRPGALLDRHVTRLAGSGARITLDFNREVGGIVSLHVRGVSDASQSLALAFAESSKYAGVDSDASSGSATKPDGHVSLAVPHTGRWTLPRQYLRGGFRYLTVFLPTAGWVDLDEVSVHFTAAPDLSAPNDFPDYFFSGDPVLNRIWYAGAYTLELATIPHDEARSPQNLAGAPWDNSADLNVAGSALTDGAKRDRAIWPGDLVISAPADYVSLHDMAAVRHSLDGLYQLQNPDGAFPFEGPPVQVGSGEFADAYHLDALIATADYAELTQDYGWLGQHWLQYERAVMYALAHLDPATGLFVVVGPLDWARSDQGGENLEANDLMYRALTGCAVLSHVEQQSTLEELCRTDAQKLRAAVNARLWNAAAGAYMDDATGSWSDPGVPLYPQDGNALAIWFGLTTSARQNQSILRNLKKNWTRIGARTPEWDGGHGIHPFPGGMEVMARFVANDGADALALIRSEWGYMLTSPLGTKSTFWEGYHTNGDFSDYYNGSYPASYTSLAHGWSAGPTAALTAYLLGVRPTTNGTYDVIPHPGDVAHVEGTVSTAIGRVLVGWTHRASTFALTVRPLAASRVATVTVAVPKLGSSRAVTINGRLAWNGTRFLGADGVTSATQDTAYVYFRTNNALPRSFAWQGPQG